MTDTAAGLTPRPAPAPADEPRQAPADLGTTPLFRRSGTIAWRLLGLVVLGLVVTTLLSRMPVLTAGVLLGLLIAGALWTPVDWIERRGLPRVAATALVMLVLIGGVVGLGTLVVDLFIAQAPQLIDEFASGARQVVAAIPVIDQDSLDRLTSQIQTGGASLSGAMSGVSRVLTATSSVLLALVLAFLFLKDGRQISTTMIEHLRADLREDVREVGTAMWGVIESYARGMVMVALADAILITIALLVIGVPLAIPIGVVTFLLSFIPVVGAFTAGIIATAVGLAHGGAATGIAVGLSVLGVQQLDSNVFQPWIMGSQLPLHPAAVMAALTAGAAFAGIWGALLGVPITAAAVAGFERLRERRDVLGPFSGAGT